ncbi:META domain-containing protein [Lunatimonas salinarum]|uniref:META domain-containing protein n=1 Tax=Lunatimonas salinarum TaxID=1774590 RepID=UPI001ADFE7CF|nr:META domain-containing protein [Lunatimonas salinarum]
MKNFLLAGVVLMLFSCGEDQADPYVVIPYEVKSVQTDIFQSWGFLYFRDRIRNTREHPPADLVRFSSEGLFGRIWVAFTRAPSPLAEDDGMWAFYGAGPVNGFGGAYQLDEGEGEIWSSGRIGQTFVGSTRSMMEFERRYFSALASMRSYSIHNNLLTIRFGDHSEEMVFALL